MLFFQPLMFSQQSWFDSQKIRSLSCSGRHAKCRPVLFPVLVPVLKPVVLSKIKLSPVERAHVDTISSYPGDCQMDLGVGIPYLFIPSVRFKP